MDRRIVAVLAAAASVYFWFQPFNSFGLFYQSGQHWGGLAYGLIVLPILFSMAVWMRQKQLSLVFSVLSLLLAGKYVLQIGESVGWGLLGLGACALVSVIVASGVGSAEKAAG